MMQQTQKKINYIYLHGFASGLNSKKFIYLNDKLTLDGSNLIGLDLNQNDFYNLTISRQINYTLDNIKTPTILIGSSMGGFISLLASQQNNKNIKALILLAPAIKMAHYWLSDQEKIKIWQQQGFINIHHYEYDKEMALGYNFIDDLKKYDNLTFNIEIPILLIHGINDNVVPIQDSRDFTKLHQKYITYYEINSEHTLNDSLEIIWQYIEKFIKSI